MTDWMLRFGPSALGFGWVVEREDGTGASAVFEADAHEDARHILVRRALEDGVAAEALTVTVEEGTPRVQREVLDG